MQQEPQSRSHIISAETKLLDESRDIRDELRILRSLAEDQDVVWKQALSDLQYYHPCTPADVKKDLDEMLSEAEKMTSYVSSAPSKTDPLRFVNLKIDHYPPRLATGGIQPDTS